MPTRKGPSIRGVQNGGFPGFHDKFLRSQDTRCYKYVKEHSRQRMYQEFEGVHQKRLLKTRNVKNETSEDFTPKYNQTSAPVAVGNGERHPLESSNSNKNLTSRELSAYNSISNGYPARRPTGVDMALGLSGYAVQNSQYEGRPARVPTTLQPLNDGDEKKRIERMKLREEESRKWEKLGKEVEERRKKEEEERRKYVDSVTQKKMADESQEVREETTRQLDKSVVKDWNYQVEFNKRLKENEKIQRDVYAYNEKQVIDDGDRMDEEEKLRRQRKLGEEKEAERQQHEEKKFQEKSLKQYQNRLNTAIYAEEDQKIKEDKVLQHEIDLHKKNVTKHILQEQIANNQLRAQAQEEREKTMAEMANAENDKVNEVHVRKTNEQKKANHVEDEYFKDYQSKLQRLESKESLRRDYLFEREQKLIGDLAHSQKQDEHERMRRHTSNYYDKIKDQIDQHEAAAHYDRTVVKRREEEARLEAERKYEHCLFEEKERKAKEAEEYRQYLIGQMKDKKGQEHLNDLNDKIFIQHRQLANNETTREIEKKVKKVDVTDKNTTPP